MHSGSKPMILTVIAHSLMIPQDHASYEIGFVWWRWKSYKVSAVYVTKWMKCLTQYWVQALYNREQTQTCIVPLGAPPPVPLFLLAKSLSLKDTEGSDVKIW